MSREVLDGVVDLCAERGAWLFSRRGLPRARARPGRPATGRVRSVRACAVARLDVEDLRPAGPAARLARLAATATRWRASSISSTTRRSARARRASSSARSRCGIATRSPIATAGSCSRTWRCWTGSSSGTRSALVGAADCRPDRLSAPARVGGRDRRSASSSSRRSGVLLLPGAVYDEPGTSGSASAARPCPRRSNGSSAAIDTRS